MRKAVLATVAGVLFCATLGAQSQFVRLWQPNRAYIRNDGMGVFMTRISSDVGTGEMVVLGEVVQQAPGQMFPMHGATVTAKLDGLLDNRWWPAHMCYTQPRQYCSNGEFGTNNEMKCWYEVDRYIQPDPCPYVPIQ